MTKKSLIIPALLVFCLCALVQMSSCKEDENKTVWENYAKWRNTNNEWLAEQAARKNPDGTPYYKTIVPNWDKSSFILMHYCNDRAETVGNLTPLYTSTVDVRYNLYLYDGTAIDSSANNTMYGQGIFRTRADQVINGWTAALENMRVGDSVEVIIPYALGYGNTISTYIPPYSNLRFNIRLVDIPYYEVSPY